MLDETLPGLRIQRARLTAETLDPLAETLAQTTPGPGAAIALLDVERAVPSSEPYHPMLENFNLQRQRWVEHVPCPVMMWVPEYVVPYLNREAPDFMDRRSGLLVLAHAPAPPPTDRQPQSTREYALTQEQRERRVAELRSRLAANAHQNDPVALRACAEWLSELGDHLDLLGNRSEARDAYARALRIGERLDDVGIQVGMHADLGSLVIAMGDESRAAQHLEAALRLNRESVRPDVEVKVLGDLGRLAMHRGDLALAGQRFLEAADAAMRLQRPERLAEIYNNMGLVMMRRGNPAAAGAYFGQALEAVGKSPNPYAWATALLNLGVTQFERDDLDAAEQSYRRVLDFAVLAGHIETQANAAGNLGNVFKRRGDLDSAHRFYQMAIDLHTQLGDVLGQARSHANLANLFIQQGESQRALDHLTTALTSFQRGDSARDAARVAAEIRRLQDSETSIAPRTKP